MGGEGLGFRVQGSGVGRFRVQGSGFRCARGWRFRVEGLGLEVERLGFRV